jgi:phosphatidylinositol alpha-1,6-mannosyltransferase
MALFAEGLAAALSELCAVTVFTRAGRGAPKTAFRQETILTGNKQSDAARLSGFDVDLWLHFNAGVTPIASYLRQPSVAYFHGNDFLKPWIEYGPRVLEQFRRPYVGVVRHALRRAAIRRALDRVACVFVNSHRTAELVERRMRIPRDKIEICWPGVDDRFFQEHRATKSSALRVLTVANLSHYVRRKNVDGVLRAIKILSGRVKIDYTVVGDGSDLPRLRRLASELGIDAHVRFLGRVSHEQLVRCYSEADLFILASKASADDVEGFGIVYLEAAAAGVASICSREGGSIDAVSDGVSGLVIPASEPEGIAAAIADFAADPDRFPPERVRAFAEQFRWPRVAAGLVRQLAGRCGVFAGGSLSPVS